ncbi:MAG: hypothetical protein U5K30_02055 [Acidimicrobiales bacterium]|nr:hypothetical protein [Acidimicrobiales bacterium]
MAELTADERRGLDESVRRRHLWDRSATRGGLGGLVDEIEEIYDRFWDPTGTSLVDTSKDLLLARSLSERGVDVVSCT